MLAFHDKVVWITGASSGVGEGLAEAFAEAGAKIILSARRIVELERVRAKLGSTESLVLPMDATEHENLQAKVEIVEQRFGSIDLLICNAGIGQRSRVTDTSLDTIRQIIEVDLISVIAHIQAVLPVMRKQQGGHIAVTSSVAGKFGIPNIAAYCAAKHGLQGFCDSLRAEEAEHNIDVSTLILEGIQSAVNRNALTGNGEPFGDEAREGQLSAVDAGRIIVRQLAKRRPEINVVADRRARAALLMQRLRPSRVYRRMAKIAQLPAWK